jgi:DAK2 domain fusion protein YloV
MATTLERLEAEHLRSVVVGYRDALRAHQERLNRLNVYPVPDGDTGTNMALTLESVVTEMGGASDLATVCTAVSHGSLMGARGNSGVILSQILRGMTGVLGRAPAVDGPALAEALEAASTAAYGAVMRPVEGTILTVAREAAEAARQAAAGPVPLVAVLEAASAAAAGALARTPDLLPVLAEAGVVDAGGAGFVLLLDAMLHVVDGRPVPAPEGVPAGAGARPASASATAPAPAGGGGEEGTDLRYEVMFLLEAPDEAVPGFKEAWAALGDSIVVVGGDGLWNCHVHTDDAGAAVEAGIDAGRPRRIQITDLRDQVEEERWVRQGLAPEPAEAATRAEPVTTGVVAVAVGDGVADIFRSLGVQAVVAGGPSMNPSTAELLEAAERVAADGIVLLPNNRNVLPVAEQVVNLAAPRPVRVVPTGSVPEGFAALMGYDPAGDAEANAKSMAEAATEVRWGEITWAVRDAATPAGPVRAGDHIGLLCDEIVVAGPDLVPVACGLLERLVDDGHELVTVVAGEEASAADTTRIAEWLGEHRPGVAVEVHDGGQPLSLYLFSAE